MDRPIPTLGNITAITISSPDLAKSLTYYEKLGFREVMRFDLPFPWIQISDGALLIMLRFGKDPYMALTYYVIDIERVALKLENDGFVFSERPSASDMVKRYLMQSPDGLTVSLVNVFEGFQQPAGPTMIMMPQGDLFNPDKYVNKVSGMFGELAHPVHDLETSIIWWEKLGFSALSKFNTPYPWAILSDGLSVVGLHQTNNFSYPVITYFAADMNEKLKRLKQVGLEGFPENPGASVTLLTPENQHINLFKMGM